MLFAVVAARLPGAIAQPPLAGEAPASVSQPALCLPVGCQPGRYLLGAPLLSQPPPVGMFALCRHWPTALCMLAGTLAG